MNLIKLRKYWYLLSLLVIIPGMISFAIKGLNLGVDFKGGSYIELEFDRAVKSGDVLPVLEDVGIENANVQTADGKIIIIRARDLSQDESESLLQALQEKVGNYKLLRNDNVGPVIGKELRNKALLALAIAFALMIVYITIRFEFLSGLAAVTALVHDVLVTVGLISILGLEVNGEFVAALLTIIGYSINDTIVIFDRIRENMRKRKKGEPLDEVFHNSIIQTLARSINTALAVLFCLVAMIFFGGVTLRVFLIALLIGVIAGCYSTIFVASPLWYDFRRLSGESL